MAKITSTLETKISGMEATTEQMIVDLADAESRDEILFAANRILTIVNHHDEAMHDLEIKDGVVTALTRKLCKAVSSQRLSGCMYYKSKIGQDRALQLSLLVTLLEHIILRSSPMALSKYVDEASRENLMTSLIQVIKIFASYGKEIAVHDAGLSKAVRLVQCLSNRSTLTLSTEILNAMLLVIEREVSLDIRTDAALVISLFSSFDFSHQQNTECNNLVSGKTKLGTDSIDAVAGMLIATLTTAASTTSEDNNSAAKDAMKGLCRLSYHSCRVRVMMAKRRDFVLVVANNLGSSRSRANTAGSKNNCMKYDALSIVENLFTCKASLENLLNAPAYTGKLLQPNLISCVLDDNAKIQQQAVRIVQQVVSTNMYRFTPQYQQLLEALETILSNGKGDDILKLHAARVLLKMISEMDVVMIHRPKVISLVGKLIIYPDEEVCKGAICALEKLSQHPENHHALVRDTELIWNLSRIIEGGGSGQVIGALAVLLCLVTEACNREVVARNSRLVSALHAVILRKTPVNHTAYMLAVDIILKILHDDNTLLNFIDLLPWLVNFANSTTSDKLKVGLVDAAMKLSAALLY